MSCKKETSSWFITLLLGCFSMLVQVSYSQELLEYHFYSNQLPVVKPQKVNCNASYSTKINKDRYLINLDFVFFPSSTGLSSTKMPIQIQFLNQKDSIYKEQEMDLYLTKSKNGYETSFSLPLPSQNDNFIKIKNKDENTFGSMYLNLPYDIKSILEKPLDIINHTNSKRIVNHQISISDTFHIVHQNGEVFIHYFGSQSFPPSTLPMNKNNIYKPVSENKFKVETQKPLVLGKPGLYVFTPTDTLGNITSWLLCTKDYFPKLQTAQDLVEPLYYILTPQEYDKLNLSESKKLALDSLWLGVAGNLEYAKKLIATYYSRVQYANEAFTNYKEGWKTDQGMIYTVFGPPDEIINESIEQQWIYKDRKNELSFIFTIQKTPLGVYEYVLKKSKEYEREWNNTVEKWRKGIVE